MKTAITLVFTMLLFSSAAFSQSRTLSTSDGAANRFISKVKRTGTSYDGTIAIDDSVAGRVSGAVRPDTVFIANHYDGIQEGSSYTSASWPIYIFQGYGQGGDTKVSGSTAMLGGTINIYNSSNGAEGRSEFTPLAYATVPIKGGNFAAGSNYYTDVNIQSPPADGQEGYLSGMNVAVQKRAPGNVIDKSHQGSNGISVYTTPKNIGFDGQNHQGDITYPLNALAVLGGYSGVNDQVQSGSQANATPAAFVGLKIGGNATSVWQGPAEYSYIPTGIDISDYTAAAINIGSPNTGHAASGTAINIRSGGGNVVVGDNIFAGSSNSSGLIQGTKFVANAPVADSQAYTDFSQLGASKWRIGKQSDGSFFAYDSTNSRSFLTVSTSGNVTLGEGAGKTIAMDGVGTGKNAYFLCMSSSGIVLLQATACTISSRRFKDILGREASSDALSKVLRLEPTIFTMKPDGAAATRDINYSLAQVGLIAEEVASVDKKAAIFEQDGATLKSYRQESIIALLVGAVKRQNSTIEELNAHSADLEARITNLEKMMAALNPAASHISVPASK